MTRVRVSLNRPQWEAFQLVKPGASLALVFGRGVGKSYWHRRQWYKLIAEYDGKAREGCSALKGVRIILLMPTFKQCVDTYAQILAAELEGEWSFLGARINKSRWRIEFPGGSWIQFFGAENADAARGMRCDVVSADECDDIDAASYEQVAIPWLSEPWSLAIQLFSGTPRRGRFGLLYKAYMAGNALAADGSKLHPNAYGLRATYLDAPKQVSEAHVESAKLTMSDAAFKREWLASWDSGDALVYPFDEKTHIRKYDGQAATEYIIGVDWGWSDPGAFIVCAVRGNGRDAVVHVVEEVYESARVESWWLETAERLRKKYPGARWYADPSQPARIEAMKHQAKVNIQPGNNKIEDGTDTVADRLVERNGMVRLLVDPACRNVISEFLTYRRKRDPRDKERVLEAIEDRNNHAMDALRYAVFTRFGKPLAARGVGQVQILPF